ncbi:PAS domain-containing sensor histidine kinase [Terrisporobacter mayombei]|nr:PAS domain-containing protein [Terrisporobacter mayombei]MCC3668271.1 PAS domain-containing protein [Terrisporobacter mayombei]MDU6982836.1 PAS domain-containing protein [Terrisporobacter othiniensis]
MLVLQSNLINLLIYSNIFLDLLFVSVIFFKTYIIYIEQPNIKYSKTESNLNRSAINMKLYDERLNNYRMVNKILQEDYDLKEKNLHILLGQFKKSALLIDEENYIINNDVVFKNMFHSYNDYHAAIKLDDFLNDNMIEKEKFLQSIENARYYSESVITEISTKDGRIFECVFSLYEEYESSSVICILSDITYEKKIALKIQENDIKYKKIVENIPYSIILEKNKEIIYNNNKLDIDLNNSTIKNIILNSATKGEINYIDGENKEISLYVDRIKFIEDNEEISLIEIKDISNYKNLLSKLEMSTNQYKTLIDTIPEAICVLDYESKEFEYANDTFFELFKIQDIENMDLDEIYNDIAISSGNINENIKYIRKTLKDGYGGLVNIESSVVLINVNKSNKMVLIIRDITEEIKVESMKKEILESEIINKDKDDFFINMSHELLTPANLLHSSNQFIERNCKDIIKREPNGEFANCIFVMKKHVEILITLINKIMELSKLEEDNHKESNNIYDIVSLCEDIVTQLNKYTAYKGINIVFDTEEEEIYTRIDSDDITKAILTLLSVVVKNSRIKSTIDFNIKTKVDKVIITIENFKRYNYEQYLDNYEEKILNLSMSIAKLIINKYKGKVDMKTNKDDCILIEMEFNMEKNINDNEKTIKIIDENFIYNEYKKICDL